MKNFAIITVLLISNLMFGQEENYWIVKLNALQLVDFLSFPTLQISTERKINPWLSLNTEFGYQLYKVGINTDTISLKEKGFKANVEGRVYFKSLFKPNRIYKHRPFLGLQIFYRKNQRSGSERSRQISDTIGEQIYYKDEFGVKKMAAGINLTFGGQFTIMKKYVLEPFIGFGIMNRKVKNIGRVYDQRKHISDQIDLSIYEYDLKEHTNNAIINIGFGYRLGYKF